MKIFVNLQENSYPIVIERGALQHLSDYIPTHKKTAIVTDTGVPQVWKDLVASQFEDAIVIEFEQGEQNKNLQTWQMILETLAKEAFHRKDQVVALGGGVAGDMAGFAAACYMRGIDFYNFPTTVLSQVDSSVGGKTAVDMAGYKNIVGAFYQPKAVVIDPNSLSTLSDRQISNGLAEALKMGCILDESLMEEFEKDTLDLDAIIARSVDLKRQVVEQDEKESGLRAILNFGHTIGHALESYSGLEGYLHGECVAMGMQFFLEDEALQQRVQTICQKLNLPDIPDYDPKALMDCIVHDKKGQKESIRVVTVTKAGQAKLKDLSYAHLQAILERYA